MQGKMKVNYALMKKEDYNWIRYAACFFVQNFLCYPYLKIFYNMKILGRENIEKGTRYIVSANHISYLDPFIVACAVNKRISFMAKKELFDDWKTRFIVHWLGAFAVNREKLEVSTIKTVKEVFKTKWWLGIFPQGTIIKNSPIAHVNRGFVAIAKAAKTDILPIGISGCEKYSWIPFSKHVVVKIGTPISYELELDEIMIQWAKQVGELSGYGYAPDDEIKVKK